MWRLGYITHDYDVYDGAHLPDCKEINVAQFSYNAGMIMQGCAYMYNVVCVPLPDSIVELPLTT